MRGERDQPQVVAADVQQLLRPLRQVLLQHVHAIQGEPQTGQEPDEREGCQHLWEFQRYCFL